MSSYTNNQKAGANNKPFIKVKKEQHQAALKTV